MYFDTHAHYDNSRFDADRDVLLSAMPDNGISRILNPGCDMETSQIAISLSEKFDFVWAAVGWHPHDAKTMGEDGAGFLRRAAKHPKVVAIGEIGLDYHYDHSPREVQRGCLARQMEIARELNLPVIFHDREAHADSMDAVRNFPDVRGVFHCYSGGTEMAMELVSIGWYISFTGVVTFKNARRSHEVIAALPLDKILLETDSPYMSPEPFRGRRCDSTRLSLIAEAVAGIKGVTVTELTNITTDNGLTLFSKMRSATP